MKKWIMMMLILGFVFPIANVQAENDTEVEEVELISIELDEDFYLEYEEIKSIQNYIDEQLNQAFEIMYIDSESDTEGVYTFLFSEEITDEHLTNMHNLANGIQVAFEEIDYTRAELEKKQIEIVDAGFEYDEFSIYQVGPNMVEGYVTVGIEPYNKENAQLLYDQFGHELVLVEEGYEMSTMDLAITDDEETSEEMTTTSLDDVDEDAEVDAEAETISTEITEEDEDLNWFQRFWRTITSWFSF